MAQLVMRNVTRLFQSGRGVKNVTLTVEDGEFFVILGPSGAGKSTLLRLIAGLDRPDSGEIEIDGQPLSQARHHRHAVGMVFQTLALYPHMSAFENIAFPLKMMGLRRKEIEERVLETAQLVGLNIDLSRRPDQLSGGEGQRVAMARALVRRPKLLLMDEPLSQLDLTLRASLRLELREFHRRSGRTFIYVTHDQDSAFALGTRIALIKDGEIAQVGSPEELYEHPANLFVARFLGNPPMNLLRAQVRAFERKSVWIGEQAIDTPIPGDVDSELIVGVRPQDLVESAVPGAVRMRFKAESAEYIGTRYLIRGALEGQSALVELGRLVKPGDELYLYARPESFHFFDPSTGRRLC